MRKYILNIKTPNKFIRVRGKTVRTPTKVDISKSEIEYFKSQLAFNSISDYSIDHYVPEEKLISKINEPIVESLEEEREEELKTNSNSILEKLKVGEEDV